MNRLDPQQIASLITEDVRINNGLLLLENILDVAFKLASMSLDEIEVKYGDELNRYDNLPVRNKFVQSFSFSLPCKEAITAIKKHAGGNIIYDVMAGTGYWVKIMNDNGIKAVASDTSEGSKQYKLTQSYIDVEKRDARDVVKAVSNKPVNIFLCWPPYECRVSHLLLSGLSVGSTLFLVGEGRGGCTGSDEMFDELEKNFKEVETIELPRWGGINDRLRIFRKVSNDPSMRRSSRKQNACTGHQ